MKSLYNEKGMALITSLMFTVLGLVISMSLLYLVTSGIKSSAAMKSYRNAVDATYGGTDIMIKDIIGASFSFSTYSSTNPGTSFVDYMKNYRMAGLGSPGVSDCFRQKLTTPKELWTTACNNSSLDAKSGTDVTFSLNGSNGFPFKVYSKIVDTMTRKFTVLETYSGGKAQRTKTVTIAGNTDLSGGVLDTGAVTDQAPVSVPHYPYVYRVEVQGERQQNAAEKSQISVLYAY